VEGHTDDIPISTEKFPSNWELSAQRAATVVRALADAGIAAQRLEAVGYADTRPLAANTSEDGRKENRRVSLFLRM
jgi:chemotaxis protein MotB